MPEIARSASAPVAGSSAARVIGPGARSARPAPAVLHRQGRRRQEHGRRGDRAARVEHRQAGAAHRGRRQGRHPRAVRAAAGRLHSRARSIPASSRWRWTPRRRCRSTCELNLRVPGARPRRPARQGARLRRERGAGREGDPHDRQDLLGGAGGDRGPLRHRPRRRRRGRDRPHRRAARRARRRSASSSTSVRCARRRSGSSELLADPAITAVNIVTTPEEMPVAETIELVDELRAEVHGAARHGRREPGAARAVHARRRGDVRSAARARRRRRALATRAGAGTTAVLDARPARGRRCGARGPCTSAQLLDAVDLPLLYVPYLFVRAHGLRVTRMVADALGEELGL